MALVAGWEACLFFVLLFPALQIKLILFFRLSSDVLYALFVSSFVSVFSFFF